MTGELTVRVDDERLAATLHSPEQEGKKICVITCHGMLSSRMSTKAVELCGDLSKRGYYCLRFDFRGCGDSDGHILNSISSKRLDDLNAVIAYARNELGMREIGLFGSSMGGYVSLIRAGSKDDIKTVVSVSTPHSMAELLEKDIAKKGYTVIDGYRIGKNFLDDARIYDGKLREALGLIDCPILFVQGKADTMVPPEHARKLYRAVGSEKEIKFIDGADHSYSPAVLRRKLVSAAVEWFRKRL